MIPNSAFFSRTRSHVAKVEAAIDSQECAVCGDQKLFARIPSFLRQFGALLKKSIILGTSGDLQHDQR